MAKKGLTLDTISQLVSHDKGWSLCVGAGCSFPLFPSWEKFAMSVARKCIGQPQVPNKIQNIFSPEVILQIAYERARRPDDFVRSMCEELYNGVFKGLTLDDKTLVATCLSKQTPSRKVDWGQYLSVLNKKGITTSHYLAEFIAKSIYEINRPPRSILTFNAEILLPSLINAYCHQQYKKYYKVLDYMVEPTSVQYQHRIPYYFCHGVIPVPYSNRMAQRYFNAADKLVFSENEYLQLANSVFSWQSSSFMNTLTNNTVFFVGLSFKDPNIRRWLAWIQKSKLTAINLITKNSIDSTSHYWIEKDPKNSNLRAWYEASVAHLGIRMIWVDDYSQIVDVLEKGIK